jgi:arginyl-tRNA synthetase
MNTWVEIKNKIALIVNKHIGKEIIVASDLVYPPNSGLGDLSLPCFQIAKELGKNPPEVSSELVRLFSEVPEIAGVRAMGPYINFTLQQENLAEIILPEISVQKDRYGYNETGENKRVMIEFANLNTHKEFHVGHLRNITFGDSIAKILKANGFKTIPVSYINDFGIHVAKTIWWTFHPDNLNAKEFLKHDSTPEVKGSFLGQMYVAACKREESDQIAKGAISFVMKKIESRQGEEYELWQTTREWSIEQFKKVYKNLNIDIFHTFYESEVIDRGREMVDELIAKGILMKSNGAVIADLEKYNLGVLVFLRSDGTSAYPVADLELSLIKFKQYNIDKSIYVVDVRQSLYFKQLFKILNLLGYQQEMVHLGHDFVKLSTGMMSSRTGNVITYEDLYNQLFDKAKKETIERHADWDLEKVELVANVLAISAIKFEMIKVGMDQIITFDINKALSFSGYTAAYIQYTCARINSILSKPEAGTRHLSIDYSKLNEDKEKDLLLSLAKYPEAVARASVKYDPSEIAKYIFELAQIFNDYYHSVPVLKADDDVKTARLSLLLAINQVLENGLELLGIKAIKEM